MSTNKLYEQRVGVGQCTHKRGRRLKGTKVVMVFGFRVTEGSWSNRVPSLLPIRTRSDPT